METQLLHDVQPTEATGIEAATQPALPPDHRSGYVAVIGRPNVGKSTLFNQLLGQKIAITSPKPQTTRDRLLGIYTQNDVQIIFFDTPGIHQPHHKLGEYMVKVAEGTIGEADVVLWLVDGNVVPTEEDRAIADLLLRLHRKTPIKMLVLGLNKVDQHRGKIPAAWHDAEYLALLQNFSLFQNKQAGSSATSIPLCSLSAKSGVGIPELVATLRQALPLGPRYYGEEEVTDLQMRFIAAEIIREKLLMLLGQEVPHSIAVEVDEFTERSDKMTYISAILYVERPSQKGIVLGEGGRMIKKIGAAARPEIEELVGTRVYLELWVKVWERWRTRTDLLRQLGYTTNESRSHI